MYAIRKNTGKSACKSCGKGLGIAASGKKHGLDDFVRKITENHVQLSGDSGGDKKEGMICVPYLLQPSEEHGGNKRCDAFDNEGWNGIDNISL